MGICESTSSKEPKEKINIINISEESFNNSDSYKISNNKEYISNQNNQIYNYKENDSNNNINNSNILKNNNNYINKNINNIIKIDVINKKKDIADYLSISKSFLICECNIFPGLLDSTGDCTSGWRTGSKNGPPKYLKDFIPPLGWIAVGLKVKDMYDNGDNTWLGTSNVDGEWYIGYHGIKDKNSIYEIISNGFKRDARQNYKDNINNNPLTNNTYDKCGEGAYFVPDINVAKEDTSILSYSGEQFRVVFMCRINPKKVRIATDLCNNKEYWIVNANTDDNLYAVEKDDEVRRYRILFYFESTKKEN